VRIVILGAGISGITIARNFPSESIVLEKNKAGGLLRSFQLKGFTFDIGGHLFHFRNARLRSLFETLMKNNYIKISRNSVIYIMGKIVPYPFQANFYPLPQKVKMECLRDFVNAYHSKKRNPRNFEEWLLSTFGEAMCRYFFFPYNRKFWGVDLKEMSALWAEWAIPRPTIEEIYNGSQGRIIKGLGYNPEFYYPKKDGAFAFFRKYSQGIKVIEDSEAIEINTETKTVITKNEKFKYDVLFSTIPLFELLKIITPREEILSLSSSILKANSVTVFNIGFEGKIPEYHWIYFPEEKFSFYRLGFYSNFSRNMAPEGFHSLYLEFSGRERKDSDMHEAIKTLTELGLLEGKIVIHQKIFLPYAYPIPTRETELIRDGLEEFLKKKDIYIAGRMGSWKYLSTEASILDAEQAVSKVKV